MSNMADPTVSQARSFKENPRHYPRKLQVGLYNKFSKRLPFHPLPENPKKILIQAQEKIGDSILLFPTIAGMKDLFPVAEIHLLCSRMNESIFQSLEEVEKTMVYRNRGFWSLIGETDYDLFYNPKDHPSITAFKIAKRVKAKVKVCLAHPRQEQHYNYGLTVNHLDRILEKNAALITEYDPGFNFDSKFPNIDNSSPINKNHISINLSAGSESRKWPLESWIELIDSFGKDNAGIQVDIFSYSHEGDLAKKIEKRFGMVVKLFPLLDSIIDAGPIIQKSSILISPDTAMIHVADAVGTPVVGLYSGDDRNVARYRPYWVQHRIIQSSALSIQSIKPDRVFEASKELMALNS